MHSHFHGAFRALLVFCVSQFIISKNMNSDLIHAAL